MDQPRPGPFAAWGTDLITVLIVAVAVLAVAGNGAALVAENDALRTARQMAGVAAATEAYAGHYDALPGDDPGARNRWPVPPARGGTGGDGIIDGAWWWFGPHRRTENRLFWQHLRRAGLLAGPDRGMAARRPVTGGHGAPLGVGARGTGLDNAVCTVMPARLAHRVDKHFDDGRPHTGAWRACAGGPARVCPRGAASWTMTATYSVCTGLDGA